MTTPVVTIPKDTYIWDVGSKPISTYEFTEEELAEPLDAIEKRLERINRHCNFWFEIKASPKLDKKVTSYNMLSDEERDSIRMKVIVD